VKSAISMTTLSGTLANSATGNLPTAGCVTTLNASFRLIFPLSFAFFNLRNMRRCRIMHDSAELRLQT
jgi:hypothetical protein